MLKFGFALLSLFVLTIPINAQVTDRKFEVGGFFTSIILDDFKDRVSPGFATGDSTVNGIGGRLTYNLNETFAIDGEGTFFPSAHLNNEEIGQKMKKEFSNYYLLRSEILSGLLNILMIHFSRKFLTRNDEMAYTKDAELVRNFKILLKKWFITKKLVADYASELCVTPNHLNRTVKKITGFTASHHIQQYIILEAKRQAIHSNGSMKEIAYLLGFDNLAHFSKFFKNNSGMNFTSFKKTLVYPGQ